MSRSGRQCTGRHCKNHATYFCDRILAGKSPQWALEALTHACADGSFRTPVDVVVGTSDTKFRAQWKARASVVDTTSCVDYVMASESSDVVILPYDESSYLYRASGVLAETVALGCMVVAPDLPVLRDQVMKPVRVGACYRHRAEVIDCVQRAIDLALLPAHAEAFPARRNYQSRGAASNLISRLAAS
jgi:hypothetical protein